MLYVEPVPPLAIRRHAAFALAIDQAVAPAHALPESNQVDIIHRLAAVAQHPDLAIHGDHLV